MLRRKSGKPDSPELYRGYNGEIVGLAMDDNMKKGLCIRAFESACWAHSARGMILHSDRGSQFTSAEFRKTLAQHDAIQSMSGTGRCYDNARMESFFATLKRRSSTRFRLGRCHYANAHGTRSGR